MEVFDRGRDFDPRIDNIVRIQAAKLRSRLVEYYASDGAGDPIVISIPKGSYAPEIRSRKPAPTEVESDSPERHRIAVLPFVNMSPDVENEYFSDGLTEELINRLAGVPELQVVARTSAFSFKGRNEDVRDVGAKLNVSTVLEAACVRPVRSFASPLSLIDVQSGFHVFSKTYQREYKDIFNLQDELAEIERGLAVDPFNPLLHAIAIYIYGRAGRYEEAKRQYAVAMNVGPAYAPIPACIGCAHEWMGHLQPAIAAYHEACELSWMPSFRFPVWVMRSQRPAKSPRARRILDQLLEAEEQSPADIGRVFLGLRDQDQALHWLELAAERRSIYLLRVPDPRFKSLLPHVRYQAILRGMGLPLSVQESQVPASTGI